MATLLGVTVLLTASQAGAQEGPDLQLPFPCGEEWRLDTWAHAPALDMVKEPDQSGTEGALLVAPAAGAVNQSFFHDNAGNVIQIDHGDGWFTTYLHLESRSVESGDEVARGDEIGRVGRTGPTSNDHPHLHFELGFNEDGSEASWGFEGSDRVLASFNGVEYGQADGETWRDVESANCDEVTETTEETATTTAPPTTEETVPPAPEEPESGNETPPAEPVPAEPEFTG